MAALRFFTLFPLSCNVHLLKDVGMIPYIMHRDYGYDATLVCFENEQTYPSLDTDVKGLKIRFLEKDDPYQFGKISAKVVEFIRRHAREIDVLNLYHNTRETMWYAMVYRMYNPKGIIYIKLDINIREFDKQKKQGFVHSLRLAGYHFFFGRIADIVSAELPSAQHYLQRVIPALRGRLLLIPNGIDARAIRQKGVSVRPFAEKEKLIITVGRIGAPEKNNELLLQAVQQVALNGWKVVLIGPIEDMLRPFLAGYFERNPHLREQVLFTGMITDRNQLYEWYDKARVFCLTSTFESFGMVFTEALYFGDYILTTDVASAAYVTDNQQTGKIVRSADELATTLQQITDGSLDIASVYPHILEHARQFRWTENLQVLDRRIRELADKRKRTAPQP